MTITRVQANAPYFTGLSTDIVSSTFAGALSFIGATFYTSDDQKWYIIKADGTLGIYSLPAVLNGDLDVGTVDQGAASLTEKWLIDGSSVTQPVSGTFWQATQPVSGPLTDVQIRATPLPISGTVTAITGGLTDTQLRAMAVPVSGTFYQATQPVSGTFFQATQPTSSTQLPSSLGQTTKSASLPVTLPSDQNISVAYSAGVSIQPTITISATPDYAIGDDIGGIITLPSVMQSSTGSAKLTSVTVVDKAGQSPQISIYFLKATPSGGTYTDNTTLVWGSGDAANIVGYTNFVTADYNTLAGISFSTLGDIGQLHTSAVTSIFVLIVADAVYNAASTSDLIITFGYERV